MEERSRHGLILEASSGELSYMGCYTHL
jgi:hypothetical protein